MSRVEQGSGCSRVVRLYVEYKRIELRNRDIYPGYIYVQSLGSWGGFGDETDGVKTIMKGTGIQRRLSGERRDYGGKAPCETYWTGVIAHRQEGKDKGL